MVRYQKRPLVAICLFILCIGPSVAAIAITPSGNIIHPVLEQQQDYYPESPYTITVTNLSISAYYGLLIGANQFSYDWQWINFTATDITMDISFLHFTTQNYLDNTSQTITYLRLEFYSLLTDADSAPTRLDAMNLNIVSVKSQIDANYIGMWLLVLIASLVFGTIFYEFIKMMFT